MHERYASVSLDDGKYGFIVSAQGEVRALRHGEEWLTFTQGTKALISLVHEVNDLHCALAAAGVTTHAIASQAADALRSLLDQRATEDFRAVFLAAISAGQSVERARNTATQGAECLQLQRVPGDE